MQVYVAVMQEQIQEGIIESLPDQLTIEVIQHVLHYPVIYKKPELCVLYDGLANKNSDHPSLNQYLETGPRLQLLLFDIRMCN